MSIEYRVISIGALASNLLWNESRPVRTQHATTTLISDGERQILVDPSLPAEAMVARLGERTGQGPQSITDVFCTTLNPAARRAIEAFPDARWLCHETELEWYAGELEARNESAERLDAEAAEMVRREIELIGRFTPAPEKLSEGVGIYPLPGVTRGCCGLLLTPPTASILITGPAVPTREHLERGMIWEQAADREAALASMQDVLDIADVIVPGFDNVAFSPQRWV
jgi:glyoxylase-like metal-dependent hydrolase (beta-lactamase superfamily II)